MPPKRYRWEPNGVSPSKYRSPTRMDNAVQDDDKDELMWSREECALSEDELNRYRLCTKHLQEDISLTVLRENDYDMSAAVEFCSGVEMPEALSPLEQKVLLAAAPFPDTRPGLKKSISEAHVYTLVPHVSSAEARNFYARCGRDGYAFPRPWTPRYTSMLGPALNNLIQKGYLSVDDNSPLYDRPGKRVTRSQADEQQSLIPRKLGPRNDLHIAMVGYDQSRDDDDDGMFVRRKRPARPPPSHSSTVPLPSGPVRPPQPSSSSSSSHLPPPRLPMPSSSLSSSNPQKRSAVIVESLQRLVNESLTAKPQVPAFASITPKVPVRVAAGRETLSIHEGESSHSQYRNPVKTALTPIATHEQSVVERRGRGRPPKNDERRMSDLHEPLKRKEEAKKTQNGERHSHSHSPYKRVIDPNETTTRRMNRQKLFIDMNGWEVDTADVDSGRRVTRAASNTPISSRNVSRASSPYAYPSYTASSPRKVRHSSPDDSPIPQKKRVSDSLSIAMVGWDGEESGGGVDNEGFVIPSIPSRLRSPHTSSSNQLSPSSS